MRYNHLYFDLDRTLWNYDANALASMTQVFEELSLHRFYKSPEDFFSTFNHYNDQLWDEYRKGLISKEDLRVKRFYLTLLNQGEDNPELSSKIGERYMYLTPRMNKLYPNALETLDYLKARNYHLYILTNGFIKTQDKKMKNSGLSPYFERVFSSEEIGINKPRKEIYHWAVSSVHAEKSRCIIIGDDLDVDIKGAKNYGIDGIWFNSQKQAPSEIPDHTIDDLSELRQIL